ncbi:hypothetical protein BV210_17745 (plasmid) [Halorientalis sp. IM1011]|uniref:hypothetical protein n=1 Tax=Halorientalis sp. IM1011 TaxID=1932360 RepID=UPI00097CC19C|nr:hypothetical protein [Halorientalis sp. IM1011]AQL44616.1 hypothetical protein BV210_17745 [Halorientalis sp. IM1011]
MKQGSTDDPFAEAPDTGDKSEPTEPDSSDEQSEDTPNRGESGSVPTQTERTGTERDDSSETSFSRTLPYIYKRDAVKENRSQRPVYLREYNETRIPELVDAVAAALGEEVTKTDVLEAAMETAIENPDQVADILRTERYGYDWE